MENQTASPNVYISERPAQTPARGWNFNPKWIFIILGLIIFVEVVLGIRYLSQSPTTQVGRSTPTQSLKGKIALLSDKKEVKVGETLPLKIQVISPAPSDGVDVIIKFDPNILKAQDSDILLGTIFSQYPLVKIDPAGEIRISGITGFDKLPFSGVGVFATINFRAKKAGVTKLSLDFTPASTTDSNIATIGGKDLLEEVENLEVVVK